MEGMAAVEKAITPNNSTPTDCLQITHSFLVDQSDPEITFNTKNEPLLEMLLTPTRKRLTSLNNMSDSERISNHVPLRERLKEVS